MAAPASPPPEQTRISRLEPSENPTTGRMVAYPHALDVTAAQIRVRFASGTEIVLPLSGER